jgi:hypothetical protein
MNSSSGGPASPGEGNAQINKFQAEFKGFSVKEEQYNFIDNNVALLSSITGAPEDSCYAMLQFLIAHALADSDYFNSKGRIRANLSIIWIAPSGSNKTPLIDNGIRKFLDIFSNFRIYGEITGKGLRQSVAKIKDDQLKSSIIWDEFGTGMKSSKNTGTSDLFEVLSQAFDGLLIPYDSVRGGAERYPPIYCNIWLSGVPDILTHMPESFWTQGFGLRSLFLKYDFPEADDPIIDTDNEMETVQQKLKEMKGALLRMIEIRQVKTTEQFMQEYNNYRSQVLAEIRKVQTDIITSTDPANFPIISKGKFPVLVMKLAMINAASRYNFTDGILTLEPRDLQDAITCLERYHQNMLNVHDAWEELTLKRAEIESIQAYKNKIKKHIISIIRSGKSFELQFEKDSDSFRAIKTEGGPWVAHAALLKNSNMIAKKFNEIIDTLTEQMFIGKREGFIEKDELKFPTTYYRLIDNEKHEHI